MDRRHFLKLSLGSAGLLAGSAVLVPDALGRSRRLLARSVPSLLDVSVHHFPRDHYAHERMKMLMATMKNFDGLEARFHDSDTPCGSDLVVIWLWNMAKLIADTQARGRPILLVERGFMQPRDDYVSLAWNGENGMGTYQPAPPSDNGARWKKYFGQLLRPWKTERSGYALVMGQRPDLYISKINFNDWAQEMTDGMLRRGAKVMYRPHPAIRDLAMGDKSKLFVPKGATLTEGTLDQDLQGAACSITFCSNVVVESVLAGVPTVSMDKGSIGWDVTSHSLDEPYFCPDRTQWCNDMAWRQFTLSELADGLAWNHAKKAFNFLSA